MIKSNYRHQNRILTDRYLDCILGEFATTVLLLLQSPVIAILIAWRFHESNATSFLYFSLSLSSLWFGCTNAAREIVKERAIVSRERLFGLHLGAYILSKFKILAILSFIQSLVLILIVNYYVALEGFILFHIGTAFLTALSGLALGLLLSSVVSTVHQADALIPLVLIPQILFSPIVMPAKYLKGFAVHFEKIMILRWSYNAFDELVHAQFDLLAFLGNLFVLSIMIIVLIGLAGFFLKNRRVIY